LISSLPYPKVIDPRRAKLAMKIGGKYNLRGKGGVTAGSWEKCATELNLDVEEARQRILTMAGKLPRLRGRCGSRPEGERANPSGDWSAGRFAGTMDLGMCGIFQRSELNLLTPAN